MVNVTPEELAEYRASKTQRERDKLLVRAYSKALLRLKVTFPSQFKALYEEEQWEEWKKNLSVLEEKGKEGELKELVAELAGSLLRQFEAGLTAEELRGLEEAGC